MINEFKVEAHLWSLMIVSGKTRCVQTTNSIITDSYGEPLQTELGQLLLSWSYFWISVWKHPHPHPPPSLLLYAFMDVSLNKSSPENMFGHEN